MELEEAEDMVFFSLLIFLLIIDHWFPASLNLTSGHYKFYLIQVLDFVFLLQRMSVVVFSLSCCCELA